MSVLEQMRPRVFQLRKRRYRLRRIFQILRRLKKSPYTDWSDLVLLNSIVLCLISCKANFSKNEVYSAFKLVDKDDYDQTTKKPILANLLKEATSRSAFEEK